MHLFIWILFLVAGLLAGGAWSAYQQGSKFMTILATALATITTLAALAWLLSNMSSAVN